jgi:hypothetical protein
MNRLKKEYTEGVDNKRRAITKPRVEYTIYGIFYEESPYKDNIAVCAAESGEEAISLLEKSLEKKDFGFFRSKSKPVVEDTGFKTGDKGIIFGYDFITRSKID